MVSIHKFRVYKAISRPGVEKSSEWDFIKVILIKDQERSKRNKEWMRIGKSGCIELNWTYCCIKKFNVALSLCGVLGVTLYFSKGFLEAATRVSVVAETPWFASWDRSPACGLLHCNRGTDCFWGASCTRHWSACHCWPAWKRGPPAECWVASWERGTEIT